VDYVIQKEQLGTGHAANCARDALATYGGPLVIAYADVPLLSSRDIVRLVSHHRQYHAVGTLLTGVLEDAGTLGRILRDPSGRVQAIVESRDATPEQLEVKEINVGVYCLEAPLVFEILANLKNENAQHQYYLTDVIGVLTKRGALVEGVAMECAENGMGVDTAEDLARARRLWAAGDTL
jgi:bifunctional UDP-N-acetylglucosamine pyrophosphorylase/glucosamine-1-phosphate N-acetyltransferase